VYPQVTYVPVQQYPWMNSQSVPQMYMPQAHPQMFVQQAPMPMNIPMNIPMNNVPNVAINTPQHEEKTVFFSPPVNERPFGTFMEFVGGLFFGLIMPFFSLITFVFESSQLARLGVMFGTADFFLLTSVAMIQALFRYNQELGNSVFIVAIITVIFFFISVILLVKSTRQLWRFLAAYEATPNKQPHELVSVASPPGEKRDYIISCILSFLFPVLGSFIRLKVNNSLQSKYGIVKGLSWNWIIGGFLLGLLANGFFLLFGLILLQCANVHFRRAYVCAGIPREQWGGCCCRRRCQSQTQACSQKV